jgi:hypothetical protein
LFQVVKVRPAQLAQQAPPVHPEPRELKVRKERPATLETLEPQARPVRPARPRPKAASRSSAQFALQRELTSQSGDRSKFLSLHFTQIAYTEPWKV